MLSRCEPEKSVRKHEALVFDQGAVVVKGPLKRIASPLWAVTRGREADRQREKLCRQSDLPCRPSYSLQPLKTPDMVRTGELLVIKRYFELKKLADGRPIPCHLWQLATAM
jgi:hypothetical protein